MAKSRKGAAKAGKKTGKNKGGLREAAGKLIEHPFFTTFITLVILANAVVLGLETDRELVKNYGHILSFLDETALGIFVVELLLKFYVQRLSFFRSGWNVFDFIIVGISLIPAIGALSVLRTLRVLRVLRLVSVVPQMRRVISALFSAIPGMASIMAVLLIIFYVSSVLATKMFFAHPLHDVSERFHSVGASMYTLFQIMTLEGWSDDIVRPVMQVYPWSWMFFIPFIIITSFAVLNLFIGIIVDAMNIVHQEEEAAAYKGPERRAGFKEMAAEMKALRKEVAALKSEMKKK